MAEALSGPYTPALLRKALDLFEEQRGWLAVSDGRRDLCWVFARDGVRAVMRGYKPATPARWLALGGGLSPEQEQKVQAARAAGLDEPRALAKAGVPPSQLEAALRSLLAQLAIDALFWDEPCCDVGVGEPPFAERLLERELEVLAGSVPAATLMADVRDRLVRASATLKALPTAAVSAVTTGESGARKHLAECADPLERQVLERVLQKPGVHGDDLVQALECGEGQLMLRLLRLIEAKVVQVERLPRDPAKRATGHWTRASGPGGPDELPRRLWLAAAAEAQNEPEAAARHLTRAGWLCAGQGRQAEASELFARALRLVPEELQALQGRVNSLWALAREEEAAQLSEALGRHYLTLGLPGQARQVLSRALQARESGHLLELSVQALIDLGEQRQAEQLTESLVLQLRKEGRSREAERALQRLNELRPQERRERTRLPAGTGASQRARLLAVAGLLLAPALGMGLLYQRRELAGRQAYGAAVAEAQRRLEAGQVEELVAAFPAELTGSEALRKALEGARALAADLAADQAVWLRAKDVLAHSWSVDLAQTWAELRALEARTPALRDALEAVSTRADTILGRARAARARVSSFPRAARDLRPGFEEGKRLLSDFSNVPHELVEAQVWIEIGSEPTGAMVTWRGQPTMQRTPLRIEVPVRGKRELRLELDGYEPVDTVLELSGLESPTPVWKLTPRGGR